MGAEDRFQHVRLRLEHLETWVALPGFSLTWSDDGAEVALSFRRSEDPGADLGEGIGRVSLEQVTPLPRPTHVGGQLHRSVWLRVDGVTGTVDELGRRIVVPLASLATLAVGRPCKPVALEFAQEAAGPWLKDCTLLPQASASLKGQRLLLPFSEIGMDGVASWLNRVDRLGPLPAIVADAATGSGRAIEAQVLELTTVAEGFHRRLFEGQPQVDPGTAAQARKTATEAVAPLGHQVQQAVREALGHLGEPSYRQRLRALAEAAAAAVPGVAGQVDDWVGTVVRARNSFAHLLPQAPPDASRVGEWLTVIHSLRWMFTGLLLLQTDVAPEVIRARLELHQPYQLFRQQAQSWLPEVYKS